MIKSNYNPITKMEAKFKKPEVSIDAMNPQEIEDLIGLDMSKKKALQQAKNNASITGGNYGESTKVAKLDNIDSPADADSDNLWGEGSTGTKVAGAGLGALDMVGSIAANKGPMNGKEQFSNTLNLTVKGASAGSAFGPVGTLVGAGVGLVTGLVMGIGDKKKLTEQHNKEKLQFLNDTFNARRRAQKLEDGKAEIGRAKEAAAAQIGLIAPKYN